MLATQLVLQTGEDAFMIPKMSPTQDKQSRSHRTIIAKRNGAALQANKQRMEGSDSELIEVMLTSIRRSATPILDATYNAGRMWKARSVGLLQWTLIRSTTRHHRRQPKMKGVRANRFGVVVYDPRTLDHRAGTRARRI